LYHIKIHDNLNDIYVIERNNQIWMLAYVM